MFCIVLCFVFGMLLLFVSLKSFVVSLLSFSRYLGVAHLISGIMDQCICYVRVGWDVFLSRFILHLLLYNVFYDV
jgi:hypothetical protein